MLDIFDTNSPIITQQLPADIKLSEETYTQWGSRWAGTAQASDAALVTSLQTIYTQEKDVQRRDSQMQNKLKIQKENEIGSLNAQRTITENNKKALIDECDRIKSQIEELKERKNELRGNNNEKNIAKIHYNIGLFICVALAIYLFVFYCSASFSAFFRTESTFDANTNTIFYPYALRDAIAQGFLSVLLIILLPVIFLGLGFIIHQFSQQKGVIRYIKIGVLYSITFIFDAIIAYEISEKVYNFIAMDSPFEMEPYTFRKAFTEPGFWIIIFAGFIAYIIWGLVFDFTMDSYSEMTSNKTAILKIDEQIAEKNKVINQNNYKITECENEIAKYTNEITTIQRSLAEGETLVDLNKIKSKLSQFFNGWVAIMPLIGRKENINEARMTFDNFCNTLN